VSNGTLNRSRPLHEAPASLPWVVGIARIAVLAVVAVGVYRFGLDAPAGLALFLLTLYVFNLISGFVYLKRSRTASRILTWTQVLLDFAVVAATVSFTGGTTSFFTFLLVIVILEAGLLLGLAQGFLFAILSTIFVIIQAWLSIHPTSELGLWYDIFIEGLSFFFTAFISGYWNLRIYRLQEFQREILDNMNSGFLITDRIGIISAQNQAADHILNIPEGSAIGRPVDDIIKSDSGGECPIITALRSQRDFTSYEFYAITGPEETKLLGLTTSRIYNARKHLTGIIASFIDLTEIDKMRQELRRQDRMAALGELAAAVAHEIRNPVAVIRSSVEELQANVTTPDFTKKLAGIALRESDHLNEIVAGFLDFTRNPITRREVFDICTVLREVEDLLRRKYAHAGNLTISGHYAEPQGNVAGDPSQIKQVFINLGINAVEAMNEHGRLDITMVAVPGSFEVRFDDEGSGLKPDQVAHIFEPFYTTKESGVGMGLAVCLRIITAHDGIIRAGSREGGGTRITVRLPAASAEEQGLSGYSG